MAVVQSIKRKNFDLQVKTQILLEKNIVLSKIPQYPL